MSSIHVLVCYDTNTQTAKGRRHPRRAAAARQDYGQRVQLSDFECTVSDAEPELLHARHLDMNDHLARSHRLRETTAALTGIEPVLPP